MKKKLSLLLILFTVLSLFPGCSPDRDYQYSILDDGTVVINKYTGSAETLDIPDQLGGHTVTCIAKKAFFECGDLTSVNLNESVKIIGDYAFYKCKHLKNINIPEGVVSIGNSVFSNCQSLENIIIPNSVTNIGEHAFEKCTCLTRIEIPYGVTNIGMRAFYGCKKLSNVTISRSVSNIGDETFYDCDNLKDITIPVGVKSIGMNAFAFSGLVKVDLPIGLSYIGDGAFGCCSDLTSAVIPISVEYIGDGAFGGCTSLSYVLLPPALPIIGDFAFTSGSTLTKISTYEGRDKAKEFPPSLAWSQNALSNFLGKSLSEFLPTHPGENVCLLAVGGNLHAWQNFDNSFDESMKEMGALTHLAALIRDAVSESSTSTLSFVADPDLASVYIQANVSYPSAGSYNLPGLHVYNCEVELIAINLLTQETIANVVIGQYFADTISFKMGEEEIYAEFPDLKCYQMQQFIDKVLEYESTPT